MTIRIAKTPFLICFALPRFLSHKPMYLCAPCVRFSLTALLLFDCLLLTTSERPRADEGDPSASLLLTKMRHPRERLNTREWVSAGG